MTVTAFNPSADTYLSEAAPTADLGSNVGLTIGCLQVTGQDKSNRGVLQFDLSSLAGQFVTGATLTLSDAAGGVIPSTSTFNAYRITQSDLSDAGNWNTYDGTNAWTALGGDYSLTGGASTTLADAASDLVFSDLTTLVNDAIANRSGILRLLIIGPEAQGQDNYGVFGSSEGAAAPSLSLTHAYAVHYACALQVQSDIQGMDLEGLSDANVLVQKVPDYREANASLPAVILSTNDRETSTPATNRRDDVGYPVRVSLLSASDNNVTLNHARMAMWRQRISRQFRNQGLSGVDGVWTCNVEQAANFDRAWFNYHMDNSQLVLRFISREFRGAGV